MPVTPESLVLDGLQLNDINGTASPRYTLESLSIPPARKRPDWVQGADSDGAGLLRDPQFENRVVTAQVRVRGATQIEAHKAVGRLIQKFEEADRNEGGLSLVWTPAGMSTPYTLTVLTGEVGDVPVDAETGYFVASPLVPIEMTCRPHLAGPETTVAAVAGTGPFATIDAGVIPGDVPAEGRLIVTDTAGVSRRYIEWGAETLGYTPASPTNLMLDSAGLATVGFSGTQATLAGAHPDGGVIAATILTAPQAVCGTGSRTHVGTFRVRMRLATGSNGTDAMFRFQWRVGDGPYSTNTAVQVVSSAANEYREIDLGLITNPTTFVGSSDWEGQVDAWTTAGASQTAHIDYLYLIPVDGGYGKARAPVLFERPTTLSTSDDFAFATTALTGRTAPVGGAWAGAGDADDFTGGPSTESAARRVAASDTGSYVGRYVTLGTTSYAAGLVQADVSFDVGPYDGKLGVLLRYVDIDNWLMASIDPEARSFLRIRRRTAGTVFILGDVRLPNLQGHPAFYSIRLQADAAGLWAAWVWTTGGPPGDPLITGQNATLATGGALAAGRPGMYDMNRTTVAVTRRYDSFYSAPLGATNAVVFANRQIEVRHDDTIRQSADGARWGRPTSYRGARFRLQPAGDAGRSTRVVVRAHRNDLDAAPASPVADAVNVSLAYRPLYLWPR